MPPDAHGRISAMARVRRNLRVIEFVPNMDALLRRADRVWRWAGKHGLRARVDAQASLIVPRTRPRREQLIRAENMHALGLLDYLEPERLSTEALTKWLRRPDAEATR